jgi:hypothetical protein
MTARRVEKGRRQTALNVLETKRCVNSGNLKISRWMAGAHRRQRAKQREARKAKRVSDPMQRRKQDMTAPSPTFNLQSST